MISLKQLAEKASPAKWNIKNVNRKTWIWIGLGLAALPALRIYYVQEMLAALIAFSILFGVIYIAVFTIFVVVRVSKPILVRAKPEVGRAAQWSLEAAEGVIASPVWAKAVPDSLKALSEWAGSVPHYLRSQQLKLSDSYKILRARVTGLRQGPSRVYQATLQTGLRKGGAALNVGLRAGLRTHRRISKGVGTWLTQRVTPADFIRLRQRPRVRPLHSRAQSRRPQ